MTEDKSSINLYAAFAVSAIVCIGGPFLAQKVESRIRDFHPSIAFARCVILLTVIYFGDFATSFCLSPEERTTTTPGIHNIGGVALWIGLEALWSQPRRRTCIRSWFLNTIPEPLSFAPYVLVLESPARASGLLLALWVIGLSFRPITRLTCIMRKKWFHDYSFCWSWMWPHGDRLLQLRMIVAFTLSLICSILDIAEIRLRLSLLESVAEGQRQQSMAGVWPTFGVYAGVQGANSRMFLKGIRTTLWMDVENHLFTRRSADIQGQLMKLGCAYLDSTDVTSTIETAKQGETINAMPKFIIFELTPMLVHCIGSVLALYQMYGWIVCLILFCITLLYVKVCLIQNQKVLPLFSDEIQAQVQVQRRSQEGLHQWKTLAWYNRIEIELNHYQEDIAAVVSKKRRISEVKQEFELIFGLLSLFASSTPFILINYSAVLKPGTTGKLASFPSYWDRMLHSTALLSLVPGKVMDFYGAADRLRPIMAAKPAVEDGEEQLDTTQGEIVFTDVTARFGGKQVFENLNLTFPARSITAIVGTTGSGKTTILDLILRIMDPVNGTVTMGGRNIKNFTRQSLRAQISTVQQISDNPIFSGSIMDNVKSAKPTATDDEVHEACRKALIHGDIMDRDGKYESNATTLSSGQQQRILWARAIVKNAPVYLLDEPTASLDAETSAAIMASGVLHGKTVIIVTHALLNLPNVDKIHVVVKGEHGARVCESGTHESLIQKGGRYADMWQRYQSRSTAES